MTLKYRICVAAIGVVLLAVAFAVAVHDNSSPASGETPLEADGVYEFSFISQADGAEVTDEVYYSDSFFKADSGQYDKELAAASLALSMTAFKEKHAGAFLDNVGFENPVSYRYGQQGDEDKVALMMAAKDVDGETVVAVAVRGGKYGDEWGSNGRVGRDGEALGYHYGFRKSAEDALVQLKEYAAENEISLGEAKIWITGFSRGAAVSNVLAAILVDEGAVDPANLYAYTFATPSTVSQSRVTGEYPGIYNVVNPLDIVTRLPMNAGGITETAGGKTVKYDWDYVKYGETVELPIEDGAAELQLVQLLENALAFATRNEKQYVEKTQDQVMIPALKEALGKGADVSRRNVGAVLVDSLPGVAVFVKNEIGQLDFRARVYGAGIVSGKRSVRLEKEHWPETYWDMLGNGV